MSTVYTGIPTNVTTPLAASVSTTTGNGITPIVITTGSNHLYATGDRVTVTGVTGNTAANGTWVIIVLSSTTFSLTGATGNGAYVSGGACSDQSLTPQFTIPSDGDAFSAAAFNVAFQTLADRTQFLAAQVGNRADVLTAASGTWTCPPNVTRIEIQSFPGGGGGGGGGGGDTTTPTNRSAPGGGGGGSGRKTITRATVVPGTVYAYANGAGGAGGAGGAAAGGAGAVGSDGGDSTFNAAVVARGAGGGYGAQTPFTGVGGLFPATPGGRSPRAVTAYTQNRTFIPSGVALNSTDAHTGGQGGLGGTIGQTATDGGCSAEGFLGGALGTAGATVTNFGGGGGGGGAGGPGGVGAAGGVGGPGSTGANATPAAPSAAAANTGAGGGGGGASGSAASAVAGGAAGSAGGSGAMTIVYFGAQAAFT